MWRHGQIGKNHKYKRRLLFCTISDKWLCAADPTHQMVYCHNQNWCWHKYCPYLQILIIFGCKTHALFFFLSRRLCHTTLKQANTANQNIALDFQTFLVSLYNWDRDKTIFSYLFFFFLQFGVIFTFKKSLITCCVLWYAWVDVRINCKADFPENLEFCQVKSSGWVRWLLGAGGGSFTRWCMSQA